MDVKFIYFEYQLTLGELNLDRGVLKKLNTAVSLTTLLNDILFQKSFQLKQEFKKL